MSFIVSYYNNSGDEKILKVVYDYLTLRETELSSGGVCCGPKEAEPSSGALRPNLTSGYRHQGNLYGHSTSRVTEASREPLWSQHK